MSQINWPAIGFTIFPHLGGIAGGILSKKSIETWYGSLKKPEWRPPNAAFAPVWTTLYTGMGYASYLVYRDGEGLNVSVKCWATMPVVIQINLPDIDPVLPFTSQINWPAVGFAVLPNIGGVAGGILARKNIDTWYAPLYKPEWRPSNSVFTLVWTALYSNIGYASYVVYCDGGGFNGPAKIPLIVYGSNVLLNWAWTPIFFGKKDPKLALAEIQLVNLTALGTGYLFYKINPVAGYLIVPYCLWLGLATALNYVIWRDNKDTKPKITELKEN